MKKALFIILLFGMTTTAWGNDQLTYTSYFPTPSGNYKNITLTPQSTLPPSNCNIGTIYVNADEGNEPFFCAEGSPLSRFIPLSGVWSLTDTNISLTDTTTPEDKKIGIGTATPIFKLTLSGDGGIYSDNVVGTLSLLTTAGAGTRLMWYPFRGAFRAGYAAGDEWDEPDADSQYNIGDNSTAMGYGNNAYSDYSTIWGGQTNTISFNAFVSGINGGKNNTIDSGVGVAYAQILGGENNTANGNTSTIAGKNNTTNGTSTNTIGGGSDNVTTATSAHSIIAGGYMNSITFILGTISGGRNNSSAGAGNTIGGGYTNIISSPTGYNTISGGYQNNLTGSSSVIGGGRTNILTGNHGTIGGGNSNTISGGVQYATISGGNENQVSTTGGSVAGGDHNIISGNYSTIIGGSTNTASGPYSIAVGGSNNSTAGDYSMVAGRNMSLSAAADYSFLWGYSAAAVPSVSVPRTFFIYNSAMGIRDTEPEAKLEINGNTTTDDYFAATSTGAAAAGNIFIIKNTNGYVGVGRNNPTHPLHFGIGAHVTAAGNFVDASSRAYKENIFDLPLSAAMDAFSKLTPVRYNYKVEKDEEYLGFIAEDVPELVAEKGRKALSPLDLSAVLTKVVAHQQKILNQQKHDLEVLQKEIENLNRGTQ